MIKRITLVPLLIVVSLLLSAVGKFGETPTLATSQAITWPELDWFPDTTLQAFLIEYEDYLRQAREAAPVPGMALGVVKDGRVVYAEGFGVRDVETGRPVDRHTVFRLASLSKGFAPVLTGILQADGCLHWDDRVADYLPWFCLSRETATRQLTLRHVLSHTTGLPRHTYSNLLNMGVSYPEILPRLDQVRLADRVGRRYAYQNVAYSLVGDVIDAATPKSYNQLLHERIFRPLGMEDASASFEAMLSSDNAALPYAPHLGGYHRVLLDPNYYEVVPAAGVNASVSDMTRWLQLMMGEYPEILPPEVLAEITAPQVPVSTAERNFRGWRGLEQAWYGLGWRVLDWRGRRLIYHGGYVRGYRAEIAFDPEERIGMVLLANGSAPFLGAGIERFFEKYWAAQAPLQ